MKRIAWIALAAVLLMGGTVFAMAQNGPATGGYPPARWNPNLYGYYGYYVPPGYALGTPYYVLGYPVPHYGYRPWRRWWW
jgi:hypothetical protein